jgi:GAF domain-containing protein
MKPRSSQAAVGDVGWSLGERAKPDRPQEVEGDAVDIAKERHVVEESSFSEFALTFSETARILFAAGSVTRTLSSLLELAVATIEGCDFAALYLVDGESLTTPVHTDPAVKVIDDLHNQTGEGPCLDAVAHRLIFYADDLEKDLRWLHFAPLAVQAGVRSLLALPLSTDSQRGALSLYSRYPAAFSVGGRARASILVTLASLALSAAHSHEDEERRTANFQAALRSREIIGAAIGILMERERISSDAAFTILDRASQHLNIKLREVARDLIDTGERPDTGDV